MTDPEIRRIGRPDYGQPPPAVPPAAMPLVPAQQYDTYGPYPPPPMYYAPPQVVMAVGPPSSGLAVASLVFGVIGIVGGWCAFGIPCFLAVLCGHAAMRDTRYGQKGGRGMAQAGLILGYIFVVPMLVVCVMMVIGLATEPSYPTSYPTVDPAITP